MDRFTPNYQPMCLFCASPTVTDITPEGAPETDRWYECPECFEQFIVRYVPNLLPPSDAVH